MPKVCTTVNLLDSSRRRVTLLAGDEIPDWALSRVTNPSVLADDEATPAAPAVPDSAAGSDPVVVDYSKLSKDDLVTLCKERELDSKGNKGDLIARLEETDKATEETKETTDIDVWELDVDELKALAEERGVDVGDATTQVELATILQSKE